MQNIVVNILPQRNYPSVILENVLVLQHITLHFNLVNFINTVESHYSRILFYINWRGIINTETSFTDKAFVKLAHRQVITSRNGMIDVITHPCPGVNGCLPKLNKMHGCMNESLPIHKCDKFLRCDLNVVVNFSLPTKYARMLKWWQNMATLKPSGVVTLFAGCSSVGQLQSQFLRSFQMTGRSVDEHVNKPITSPGSMISRFSGCRWNSCKPFIDMENSTWWMILYVYPFTSLQTCGW